jgi:hypothetical protein
MRGGWIGKRGISLKCSSKVSNCNPSSRAAAAIHFELRPQWAVTLAMRHKQNDQWRLREEMSACIASGARSISPGQVTAP